MLEHLVFSLPFKIGSSSFLYNVLALYYVTWVISITSNLLSLTSPGLYFYLTYQIDWALEDGDCLFALCNPLTYHRAQHTVCPECV